MLWNHNVMILDLMPLGEFCCFVFDVNEYLKLTTYLNVL